jgi:hypothetical protein
MNERIKLLAEQARSWVNNATDLRGVEYVIYKDAYDQKFAELIVAECIEIAKNEMFSKETIEDTEDNEDQEYLRGNNGGIVDVIVAIRNHFRDENEVI